MTTDIKYIVDCKYPCKDGIYSIKTDDYIPTVGDMVRFAKFTGTLVGGYKDALFKVTKIVRTKSPVIGKTRRRKHGTYDAHVKGYDGSRLAYRHDYMVRFVRVMKDGRLGKTSLTFTGFCLLHKTYDYLDMSIGKSDLYKSRYDTSHPHTIDRDYYIDLLSM
tara:strand:- start:89 stop:574 length:486 start_codon:yes stop_codon:yes gene_type:complete